MSTTNEHLPGILLHLGYKIIIGRSIKDQCYKAWTPELREDIIQPCAHGETYEEVVNNAKEVIEMFVEAVNDEE
jgi:predicted RNase H-like HicB family nuclease